jgi:hypothetical protein
MYSCVVVYNGVPARLIHAMGITHYGEFQHLDL